MGVGEPYFDAMNMHPDDYDTGTTQTLTSPADNGEGAGRQGPGSGFWLLTHATTADERLWMLPRPASGQDPFGSV